MTKFLVTGGAGFIGSYIVGPLLKQGDVTVYDNLNSGRKEFLEPYKINFIEGDLLDKEKLQKSMKDHDFVYHLAANPDIKIGTKNTKLDIEQGTIATYNVLECMRLNDIKEICYSSSSTVYGEAKIIPTPEDYGPLMPISLYGASKLACEGLVSGFCGMFNMKSWIFRFANIVGKNSTHGIIHDFLKKLEKNKKELEILGDGNQTKSYLHAEECVNAMLCAVEKAREQVNIFNIGSGDQIKITRIAEIVVEELGLKDVKLNYTGEKRGWPGDVTEMMLSMKKINKLGWKAEHNSEQAVRKAVKELIE